MSTRLIPPVSPLTEPYWDAARNGQLLVQQCGACKAWSFPARANCPHCGASELSWQPAAGTATVYSYTVAHRPPHPVLAGQCPLVIAIVELIEGPRMMTNIVNTEQTPEALELDMPLKVTFTKMNDDITLPYFEPEGASS